MSYYNLPVKCPNCGVESPFGEWKILGVGLSQCPRCSKVKFQETLLGSFDSPLDKGAAYSPSQLADLKAEGREMMRRHWERIDGEMEDAY